MKSLIAQSVSGRSLELRFDLFFVYPKLKHPELSKQLRPYLSEKTYPAPVRILCADIARACALEDLSDELAHVALDVGEDLSLRTTAAVGVADFGSLGAKGKLRPLAFGEAGDDPEDELRGAALDALWPDQISMQEILPLLQPAKYDELHGRYSSFLAGKFVQKMKVVDLPTALGWAAWQGQPLPFGVLGRAMEEVIELCGNHLDEPGVAVRFAEVILARMQTYDALVSDTDRGFTEKLEKDSGRRHKILGELLPRLGVGRIAHLITFQPRLLFQEDFGWLLDRVLSGQSPESLELEAKLIFQVLDERNRAAVERLWYACEENALLKAEYGQCFGPIALDSPEARLCRENLALRKVPQQPKLLDPPPSGAGQENTRILREWSNRAMGAVGLRSDPRANVAGCDTARVESYGFAWVARCGLGNSGPHRIRCGPLRGGGNPRTEEWITTARSLRVGSNGGSRVCPALARRRRSTDEFRKLGMEQMDSHLGPLWR